MTLNKGDCHPTGNGELALQSDYFHSKLDGCWLNSFWNNQTFITLIIKICVTLNESQGRHNKNTFQKVQKILEIKLKWFQIKLEILQEAGIES